MPTERSAAPCGRTGSSPTAPAAAVSGPTEEAMTTRLDVSVLICTRDRSALVEGCLDSVLACSPAPVEVVVVDQSRDQATRRAVDRRQGAAVPVRYVRGIGHGLSRAKNQGVPECAGAIIAFTDDDCLADPRWVEALTGPIVSGRAGVAVGGAPPGEGGGGGGGTTSVFAPQGGPGFSRAGHPPRRGGGGDIPPPPGAL